MGGVNISGEVHLRREVYRQDLEKVCEWLKNPEVNEYLNEEENICDKLESLMNKTPLDVFTPQLNRNGLFFMIDDAEEGTVGYLRLASKSEVSAEMVVAIGETACWGKGLGSLAIREGLKKAFFDLRQEKVKAKIHPENERSLHVFEKEGFSFTGYTPSEEIVLEMEQSDFLNFFL